MSWDDLVAADDPFGGRLVQGEKPQLMVQVGEGWPLYWAFQRRDLQRMAHVLAYCWQRLGVRPGHTVAIYDYGTSPLVMFASGAYTPYLEAGASDLLGCTTVCNDGLPEMALRALHLLKYLLPSFLFLGEEGAEALAQSVRSSHTSLAGLTEMAVLAFDERPLSQGEINGWRRVLGVPVAQLLRSDLCLFLAPPCPKGLGFHPPPWYRVEVTSGGRLVVTNLALTSCAVVRHVTDIVVSSIGRGQCPCGEKGAVVRL